MLKRLALVAVVALSAQSLKAQGVPPNLSQVVLYSGLGSAVPGPSGAVPSVFSETAVQTVLGGPNFGATVTTPSNYSTATSFAHLVTALNVNIATALAVIPLSSPASGVIHRVDPQTQAELPESSTLGTIFTERAETIGKRKFYVGVSHQDFHFTHFNGISLNNLSVLYNGGYPSAIATSASSSNLAAEPATFSLGMNIHLSQDIVFFTYGVTDRLDVSLGLPVVHAGVEARTYNGLIYAGTGFGNPTCWCVDTFSPGSPTLELPEIGQAGLSRTGLGDVLVRVKGTALRKRQIVVAVGGDFRFATGDAQNYLGAGTTSAKPFAAVSLYSKPYRHVVFSPHFDVGWQFAGKSILGGEFQPSTLTDGAVSYQGAPFAVTKDYLPDVFTWAGGAEVALGHRNTAIVDILGNQIGWIHGVPNLVNQSVSNLAYPEGPNGNDSSTAPAPTMVTASGLVSAGRVAFGQYSGAFGYKTRIIGNLVADVDILVRFDNNGLRARTVPLYGLSYTF